MANYPLKLQLLLNFLRAERHLSGRHATFAVDCIFLREKEEVSRICRDAGAGWIRQLGRTLGVYAQQRLVESHRTAVGLVLAFLALTKRLE